MPKAATRNQEEAMALYADLLEEAKVRIGAIEAVLSGNLIMPGPIAHEFCFLQLRFICELIALGCLVVHGEVKSPKTSKAAKDSDLKKQWSAQTIIESLEKLHPAFYPIPHTQEKTGPHAFHLAPVTKEYLTKDDLIKLYNICNDNLHRGNLKKLLKGRQPRQFNFPDVLQWAQKVGTLLSFHMIPLFETGTLLLIVLRNINDNERVQVAFAATSSPTPDIVAAFETHAGKKK